MLYMYIEAVAAWDVRLWLYRGIGNLVSGTPHLALLADGEEVSINMVTV